MKNEKIKPKNEDVFEIRIPNLRKEEVPIVREAVNRFTKKLLNMLVLRRSQQQN